jgi:hypothetical protein
MEKQFLGPFPSGTADGVVVGLPHSLTQTAHVMFIICDNKWYHSFPPFVAEITLRWCGVNIRQHVNFFPVSPQYGCQVTPCSHFNITTFQLHFPRFKVMWHSPPVWFDSPTTVDFFLHKVIK